MDFEDERYVRLYTRDTATYLGWHWHTRAVFKELLRKVDRNGSLEYRSVKALCAVVLIPVERVVRDSITELVDDGTVVLTDTGLHIPKFVVGQTSRSRAKTSAERTAEWKSKTGYKHTPETAGDDASPPETSGDAGAPKRSVAELSEATPTGGAGVEAKPKRARKPPAQLDFRALPILDRIDAHRVRLELRKLWPSERIDKHICARLDEGVPESELLAAVDARADEVERDPSQVRWFDAVSPFTGPHAGKSGGWSVSCRILDQYRRRTRSNRGSSSTHLNAEQIQAIEDEEDRRRAARRSAS